MDEQTTEVSAETALGKFRVAGKDVNTITSAATLLLVVYLIWQTAQQSSAFHEMAQAIREHNCLISIPESQREAKADFCKRITK